VQDPGFELPTPSPGIGIEGPWTATAATATRPQLVLGLSMMIRAILPILDQARCKHPDPFSPALSAHMTDKMLTLHLLLHAAFSMATIIMVTWGLASASTAASR